VSACVARLGLRSALGELAAVVVVLAAGGCPTFPPPLDGPGTLGATGSGDDGSLTSTSSPTGTDTAIDSSDDAPSTTGESTGDLDTTTGEPGCASTSPAMVGDCDPYAQDCPAGEKCLPYATMGGPAADSTRCSPVPAMPAQYGEHCVVSSRGASGQDSCDVGLVCSLVDAATLEGTCRELCKCGPNEGQCFEAPADCGIFNGGALPICLPHCDPLVPICGATETCVPTRLSAFPVCAADASGDAGVALDVCEFVNACDPGLWCLPAAFVPGCMGDACCTPVCDLEAPDCTAVAGTGCEPWYAAGEAPDRALERLGVCRTP
jgi:hypothetical protein